MQGKGYGIREIARAMGRSPSSISEEIKRNKSRKGVYDPIKADHKAYVRAKYRRFQWQKIEKNQELKEYIIAKLHEHWNPDEISGRMRKENLPFYASKTAIYEWLRTSRGDRYCNLIYSRRHRVKKRKTKAKRTIIPHRLSIEKRPLGAINRSRYGHWENDTMVSGKKTGSKTALTVMYERKARYLDAKKIKNLRPGSNKEAVLEMKMDKIVKSMTFDNGIENARHYELGLPTYFCDPYSSWQKGGVENVLKILRRSFPKGMDLSLVKESELKEAVSIINRKPRRSLGFQTAEEVALKHGIIKKDGLILISGVRIQG